MASNCTTGHLDTSDQDIHNEENTHQMLLECSISECIEYLNYSDRLEAQEVRSYIELVEYTKQLMEVYRMSRRPLQARLGLLLESLSALQVFESTVSQETGPNAAATGIIWGLLKLLFRLIGSNESYSSEITDLVQQTSQKCELMNLYIACFEEHQPGYLLVVAFSDFIFALGWIINFLRHNGPGLHEYNPARFSAIFTQTMSKIDRSVQDLKSRAEAITLHKSRQQQMKLQEQTAAQKLAETTSPERTNENGQHNLYSTSLDIESYDIRILSIQPGSGDDPIQCTLELASLINPGSYIALSYCWGILTLTAEIIVNTQIIPVRANLATALKRLREHGFFRVWVDALCINQGDRVERSLQVRNMMQIYSVAKFVFVWAGDAGFDEVESVKYLLGNLLSQQSQENSKENDYHPWPSDADRKRGNREWPLEYFEAEQDARRQIWEARKPDILQKFFERPYWKRVWIIQEVAVATKVKVYLGHIEIPWHHITNALEFWRKGPGEQEVTAYVYSLPLLDFRHRYRVTGEPLTLFEALRWSHQALATDPRDKIFALLGLTSDGDKLVPLPNYRQPMEDILREMTRKMIISEKSLDFICIKGVEKVETSNQPSWVPDWLNFWTQSKTWFDTLYTSKVLNHRGLLSPTTDEKALVVKGCAFDEIYSLSSAINTKIPTQASSHFQEFNVHNDTSFQSWATAVNLAYPKGPQDAIWSSLCLCLPVEDMESTSGLHHIDPYCYGVTKGLLRRYFERLWTPDEQVVLQGTPLLQWLHENRALQIGEYTLEDWFKPCITSSVEQASSVDDVTSVNTSAETASYKGDRSSGQTSTIEPRNFIRAISRVIETSMRLMVTKDGIIGMAHPAAQIGDQICKIQGCSRLLILRRKRDNSSICSKIAFHVVGTAMSVSGRTEEEQCGYTLQELEMGDLVLY